MPPLVRTPSLIPEVKVPVGVLKPSPATLNAFCTELTIAPSLPASRSRVVPLSGIGR